MLIQDLGTATHKKTNINAIQLHFKNGIWNQEINIKDFIKQNVEPYYGDESFLQPPTQNTIELWKTVSELMKIERQKGILDADTKIVSSITSHAPGYINKNLEKIVGLQTDAPLKRAIIAFGGIRLAKQALESYGYKLDPETEKVFKLFRKTHNDGVFDAYTDEMLKARRSAIITGLPDAYGRGRIIGDYRRVALYGVDQLIKEKKQEWQSLDDSLLNESMIQLREEISEQIKSLSELKEMALSYGFDISHPATNGQEATQWLYFAYLASAKEQNGAAMSLGRVSTFLDI